MADLVALEEIVSYLRLSESEGSARAEELQRFIDDATAVILDCCNTTEYRRGITLAWVDEDSTPAPVRLAIKKQVAYLHQYRGDEAKGPVDDDGLAPGVSGLLIPYRDPLVV